MIGQMRKKTLRWVAGLPVAYHNLAKTHRSYEFHFRANNFFYLLFLSRTSHLLVSLLVTAVVAAMARNHFVISMIRLSFK